MRWSSPFRALLISAVVSFASSLWADLQWEPLCEPGGGGWIVGIEASPHNPKHVIACGDMLGLGVTFDGGESWIPGQALTTYEMAQPTFHPVRTNEVWVGSCSGPYVSYDGGRTWASRRVGMPAPQSWTYTQMIEKILIDATKPEKMFAFGGNSRQFGRLVGMGSIWVSDNSGASWRCAGTLTTNGFQNTLVKGANIVKAFWDPDQKRLHAVALKAGWFTSSDGGESWARNPATGIIGDIESVSIDPTNSDVVWVITEPRASNQKGALVPGALWKSVDGGKTFVQSDKDIKKLPHASWNHVTRFLNVAISPHNSNFVYVSDASWSAQAIWRSCDGGESWRRVLTRGNQTTACYAGPSMLLSFSPAANELWAVNSEFILKSTDNGDSWHDQTAYRPDPEGAPHHWRGRGWNGWCSIDYVFDPYRRGVSVALAMDAGHGWMTHDGFKTWSYAKGTRSPWSGGTGAAFSKDGFVYITTGQNGHHNGVLVSQDGGQTWRTSLGPASGLPPWNEGVIYGAWVNPDQGQEAFVLIKGKRYLTNNGGKTWQEDDCTNRVATFVQAPGNPKLFYFKNAKGIWSTADWRSFNYLGLEGHSKGRMACDHLGRLYVCRFDTKSKAGLWRYDQTQGQWTLLNSNKKIHDVAIDPADARRIVFVTGDYPYHDFAGGDGIWISDDDGSTWRRANKGLAIRRFECCVFDPFDPEVIIAGSTGGGFYKARWRKVLMENNHAK